MGGGGGMMLSQTKQCSAIRHGKGSMRARREHVKNQQEQAVLVVTRRTLENVLIALLTGGSDQAVAAREWIKANCDTYAHTRYFSLLLSTSEHTYRSRDLYPGVLRGVYFEVYDNVCFHFSTKNGL